MLHSFDPWSQSCSSSDLLSGSEYYWVQSISHSFDRRNVITFAYPVYASFASLKTGKIEEEPKWLTYWILYALSCVLDSMGLVHSVIPYFSLVRFIFLVLCFIPQVNVLLSMEIDK